MLVQHYLASQIAYRSCLLHVCAWMRCGNLLIKSTQREKFYTVENAWLCFLSFPGVKVSFVGGSIHMLLAPIGASVISINHGK